uniref:Ribonuclease E n=1 Tax=Halydictyon mirabile TaxID=189652 RepID=A0A4D6WUH1_9FLOR|nr:ribonuclease E [Halydictyon mirabile]
MVKKIIISYFNNIAAVLNNNKIEEIIVINHNYQVNDIYIGIVQKIFSSINAAFIKLGKHGKSGFIHISDTKGLKKGRYINNINDILSVNQLILVQIVKEPTFYKGPRLTTNIHLHGKYLVLTPFCNIISISHKIYDENEQLYLYSLAVLIKPQLMGLIIKQSAQGISEKFILRDLNILKNQWAFIEKTATIISYPSLIYKDEDLIKKVIRDFYHINIKKIVIDSKQGLRMLYYHLNQHNSISPIAKIKLQLYKQSKCLLDQFNIKKNIKEALKPKVKLLSGGYIIIENYEALSIIDVNSGSFNKSDNSKEAILKTNFYAAIEIAYQLRLRNLNGVIIIDFIDMYSQKDQLQLLEHFSRLLKYDDAKPQIVQLSELGFIELTRKRRGQSLKEMYFNSSFQFNQSSFDINNKLKNPLFYSMFNYNTDLHKRLITNKNIISLFFDKKFYKNIVLDKKIVFFDHNLYIKYFIVLDKSYPIYFFNPKSNHIVPLLFYLNLINF